jgi:hypothetical protein
MFRAYHAGPDERVREHPDAERPVEASHHRAAISSLDADGLGIHRHIPDSIAQPEREQHRAEPSERSGDSEQDQRARGPCDTEPNLAAARDVTAKDGDEPYCGDHTDRQRQQGETQASVAQVGLLLDQW